MFPGVEESQGWLELVWSTQPLNPPRVILPKLLSGENCQLSTKIVSLLYRNRVTSRKCLVGHLWTHLWHLTRSWQLHVSCSAVGNFKTKVFKKKRSILPLCSSARSLDVVDKQSLGKAKSQDGRKLDPESHMEDSHPLIWNSHHGLLHEQKYIVP